MKEAAEDDKANKVVDESIDANKTESLESKEDQGKEEVKIQSA